MASQALLGWGGEAITLMVIVVTLTSTSENRVPKEIYS